MSCESYPIKIKNFGRDLCFRSIEGLKESLVSKFKGKDTSIVYRTKPNGMLSTVFVSVGEDGVIRESYGDQPKIDFDCIAERMM